MRLPPTTGGISSSAAIIGLAVALAVAPTATASNPERTLITPSLIVVSEVCAFDVGVVPNGKDQVLTVFDNGRTVVHSHSNPTVTNLARGKSLVYSLREASSETADATGAIVGTISGQFNFLLFPGDEGPSGVDPDGAFLHIVGHLRYTLDADTFAITSFSVDGTVNDICAELAT